VRFGPPKCPNVFATACRHNPDIKKPGAFAPG
jgi:hypothetical protein